VTTGPVLAVVLVVLIVVATVVTWAGRLGLRRAAVTASLRAVLQLGACRW
jgi:putative ABC transport system permease protein